jgi:hypothetical protein
MLASIRVGRHLAIAKPASFTPPRDRQGRLSTTARPIRRNRACNVTAIRAACSWAQHRSFCLAGAAAHQGSGHRARQQIVRQRHGIQS